MTFLDTATAGQPALTVSEVTKTFTGTKALDDVSITIAPGSVHALLGGNGSGKSTLIKILAGVYRADPGGEISAAGTTLAADRTSPAKARELGLRFVHQDPGLVKDMTIAENIALTNGFSRAGTGVGWRTLRRRTARLLDRFGIRAHPDQRLGDLRPADQTMVAVARALEDDESSLSTLVLDEPTASLPAHEVQVLLEAMRRVAAAGQPILFVSHRIDEVLSVADEVTVLRDGRRILSRPVEGLTEAQLVEAIVGRAPASVFREPPAANTDAVRLAVSGLAGGPILDASFQVRQGEVVGIAGLLGSGRSELLRMLYGAMPAESGELELDGRPYRPRSPRQAIRAGVAFVPEDRAGDAAFLDMSVRENLSIAHLSDFREPLRFRHDRERDAAAADIAGFGIRTRSQASALAALSGGNRQKVVLARNLRLRPRLLLLDEPTQGIDVGARADIFALLADEVARGLSVIIVSSDFEELARVTDRVLILRSGRIAEERPSDGLSAAEITELVYPRPERNHS
jgi:ribose transport system ATP-binding protein